MLATSARRMVARASHSNTNAVRVQLRNKSVQATAVQRLGNARHLAHTTRGFFTRKPEAVPIVQALTVDKFGNQRRVEVKVSRTPQQKDADDVLLMAKWTAALLASGACIGATMSENSQAHSAGAGGVNTPDAEDLIEQLKKKVKAFGDESVEALKALLPANIDAQKQIDEFLASGKGGQVSWGFLMGACSGFALKKVSKLGALALGTVFVLFQCASYAGYIDVNQKKIEKDMLGVLDINKDGEFDSKDVDEVYKQVLKVLQYNMPAGSGFTVGFLLGFRSG